MAKKITPKKKAPDPIVVLEEWYDEGCGMPCRLAYDAITDAIYVQVHGGHPANWGGSIYPDDRLAVMP